MTDKERAETIGYILRHKPVELKIMNELQKRGYVSDNCIAMREVHGPDLEAALEQLMGQLHLRF